MANGVFRRLGLLIGALTLLATALVGWWVCRQKEDRRSLFRHLPGEGALVAFVDVERFRAAQSLAPLLRSRVDPDPDYAAFVKQTGFDYQRDLNSAAICYLPDRVYILARGRFDSSRLSRYALAQGGACSGSDLSRPCHMPASRPNRQISFLLLSRGVLALATAPEPDAVLQLQSPPAVDSVVLAASAVAMAGPSPPLLWATASPANLNQTLPDSLPSNMRLFPTTLAGAQRAYLFLNDRSPNLEISLKAVCNSEAQAGEMRRLLQGLNDFIAGLLRGARRGKPAGDWERVLASAAISQQASTVSAAWTLDQDLLRSLGKD